MNFTCSSQLNNADEFDCICLPILEGNKLSNEAKQLDEQSDKAISSYLATPLFKAKAGNTALIPKSNKLPAHILLIGLGDDAKLNQTVISKSFKAAANALKASNLESANVLLPNNETLNASHCIKPFIQALAESCYAFDTYKSDKNTAAPLSTVNFITHQTELSSTQADITYGEALALGLRTAKDLGNEPGNVCTPSFLADQALELAANNTQIETQVLEESEMEALGMGAFLSVSKGSTEAGKLIIIKYSGTDEEQAPHVLLGKGITFDTGGISLKPGAQMDEMKYDMCGSASVLGTMNAIAKLQPTLNVIGVIAAAENMPAGNASKPGDIVTTASGQTVEILNTDAEGRLVLCDALTYIERFKPASVVDIATLTGACIVALGHSTSAVMSNDDQLVEEVLQAGREANDKAWQLPIWEEYHSQLDSPFADMQNIGGKGAGSITAACFLSKFATKYPWAHLDIAGTAWSSGGKDKGATGRPVPLLLQYLMNKSA